MTALYPPERSGMVGLAGTGPINSGEALNSGIPISSVMPWVESLTSARKKGHLLWPYTMLDCPNARLHFDWDVALVPCVTASGVSKKQDQTPTDHDLDDLV